MSYLLFNNYINKEKINVIFELGSRDLIDAIKLLDYYDKSTIYSFECNPDCLIECEKLLRNLNDKYKNRLSLIKKAVSLNDNIVSFYPFDLNKYNNMGASSMLKINFKNRDINDPDYNLENPQYEIKVDGIRLDTFAKNNNISNIDLLCIDLQGYELNAIKSLGELLHNVKYIITECSIDNTYENGCNYKELEEYLNKYNFKYVCSDNFGTNYPNLSLKGFSEFNALFVNSK